MDSARALAATSTAFPSSMHQSESSGLSLFSIGWRTARERGAVLLAALCFATVLLVALGSYVTLCYRTLELSTRGLVGSQTVDLAEAGIEDALWALNKNDWSAWAIAGTTATRTITGFSFDGGVTGSISLRVENYDGSTGVRTIVATGTTVRPDGSTISRSLAATSIQAPQFVNAVAATTGRVRFTSANPSSTIDSYDSSQGEYSSELAGYSAVISAGSTATSSATVQLTNAQVKGFVATLETGPSYSTSATLKGPTTPPTTKIDLTRISTSPYQPIFDVRTVTGAGSTLVPPESSGTVTIGTPGATEPSIYYVSDIDMTGSAKIVVQGPVKLVVSGNLYIGENGGNPSIVVESTGTLEAFVSGDLSISGKGIDNQSKLPKRVAIYGVNNLNSPEMDTSEDFYGVIYVPDSTFRVRSNNHIYGAIVAQNVTFSGNSPKLHYDINLRTVVFSGIETPFAVSDWRESTNDT